MNRTDRTYKNVFTVDVEDWYHSTDLRIDCNDWNRCESRIVESTGIIMDLLDEANVKAVFFVLTDIAKKHPDLVKKIKRAGHEIGSHGCNHKMVSDMSPKEFLSDIQYSKKLLQELTGDLVHYFRAPVWSISRRNTWALELLEDTGFVCDSSMQPVRTPLSGDRQCYLEPFRPVVNGKRLSLVEFPSTVWSLGFFRMAFAGGLFLRMTPVGLIARALRRVNQERPGMVYVHPWEVDLRQPKMESPCYTAITHYGNLGSTVPKLRMLLKEFQFVPMKKFLETKDFPDRVLCRDEQGCGYDQ